MEVKLRVEDMHFKVDIPDDYSEVSRLTWRDGRPGVLATDPKGKQRFIRAYRTDYGKKNQQLKERKHAE